MTTDVIGSVEGLVQLEPEWSDLHRRCPRATPFQSPEWLLPWMRHLFGGGEIWALVLRENQELVGFVPYFCWGVERRTVSFLGAGISDYGDLLFAPGRERECVAAAFDFLGQIRSRWDVLDLQELRAGSGFLVGREAVECSRCPVLDLGGYPSGMDSKHRTDLRRAQNKLGKNAEVQIEFTDDLEDFFLLHEARWGPIDDSIRRFHREAAAKFATAGLLRLSVLRVGNAPAAAIYAFSTGTTLYCYLSGFDPAMAKLSPGAVLLAWTIERAIDEGIKEIDFLRQTEAYKYLWGAKDRINYKLSALD